MLKKEAMSTDCDVWYDYECVYTYLKPDVDQSVYITLMLINLNHN